jgi:hypothetical protein
MNQDMIGSSATPAPETEQPSELQHVEAPKMTPQQEALVNLARLAHLAVDLLLEKSQA